MSDYDGSQSGAGEYDKGDEAGESKLLRQDAEAERRWCEQVKTAVETLLWSLTPEDGKLDLFTWEERKTWRIASYRKRPRGV